MDYTTRDDDEGGVRRLYTSDHITATVVELDDDAGYIERIDVDEGFCGQGIGTAAVREILEDFDVLYAAPDNEGSERFFGRLGEKVVGDDVDSAAPKECLYYLDQGYGVYEVA